ncbi:hypothetical protein C8Z91_23615 [Paenibacillus elgii]|uniref:Uncharacterized protein n=1 Tax=Paenibacillus elgii TaxID=189691 RepID=A0A2T6FWX8_9BACL|nr:hypothetical protein [Paenibacillus elgii]PUA36402.1 hypothetical protein C8Z91_23615 [Paenibacillus elgii]
MSATSFVKIKKSYKKVTFLVAQKIRHIQPGAGYEKDIFLSEKNKVTFLPIKNKTYAALFLKKWQEILHYPLQLQSLSVSTILTYLLLLNQVCRLATFKTALRSATEPFRFL